ARAYCIDHLLARREPNQLDAAAVSTEISRFDSACAAAAAELETISARVAKTLGKEEADLIQAHRILLRDPALIGRVKSAILNRHVDARTALQELLDEYTTAFG